MPKRILTEDQRKRKIEGSKRWVKKNPDKNSGYNKKYYLKNKDLIREKQKQYREKNREKLNEKEKQRRKKNRVLTNERQKIYDKRSRLKSFILFIAQNFKIITEIVPNYGINNFEKKIVNLELI